MTRLIRKVRREFSSPHKPRPWIITLHPDGYIGFKDKRQRKEYRIPIELCYYHAVKFNENKTRRTNVRSERS